MFVFAWSLLSSYAESVRKRRLHTALSAFFASASAGDQMIVCRPAAHRLTRLLGVGFSSWGAETANGSLARVASEPFLYRSSGDSSSSPAASPVSSSPIGSPIYRSELMEVVAMPDECISSSDWRLLPASSSSHFAPSPASSVFFVVAVPPKVTSSTTTPPSPTDAADDLQLLQELQEGEVVLESSCMRVGWNRTRPQESLYACDLDTFTSVVFAWTNGLLRATLKGREPVLKMRTVWLAGPQPAHNNNGSAANGGSAVSSPPSGGSTTSGVRSDDGDVTPRALSPASHGSCSRRMRASMEEIVPSTEPRPLLEQLFIGDAASGNTFGSYLSSALKAKLGSDGALNLMGNATLPRRGFTRRAQFSIGSAGGLPPLPGRDFQSGGALMGAVSSSVRSLRSSRSSLRHRQASPLAWGGSDLQARFAALSPRILRDRPKSFSFRGDRTPPSSPVEQLPHPELRPEVRPEVAAPTAAARTPTTAVERTTTLTTIHSEDRIEDLSPIDWTAVKENSAEPLFVADIRTQPEQLPYADDGGRSFVSPSITISSDLDEHSLAEGRLDTVDSTGATAEISSEDTLNQSISSIAEEEEVEMPLDALRSSSARKSNTPKQSPTIKRQDTEPPGQGRSSKHLEASPKVHSARSPRRNGPAVSPMIEALRGCSKSECSTARDVAVDPQLQRLTTIELLQRRRHSTMMYNLEDALYNHDGSRRRSLSPMALSASLQGAAFGALGSNSSIASGATDILRGSLFDTRRRSQSRRLHSISRETRGKPKMKPPCVLVYTAGVPSTYERIHAVLAALLPPAVYTVFNISPEAIRKHHWIDPSSACLILADTHELDDAAWKQLQDYFNKSGRLIFVCQNSLLASISSCESVKKQVSLLRMAFGEKGSSGSMSKDLESFLKKTLKTLAKHGEVHERYQSKDLVGGLKYSVVLAKKQDSPLLLYMESGGAHSASAVFSDATIDQLLAPGSRIVADALSRIGVKIENGVKTPSLSIGYFISDEEFLNECKSLRYGVEIGDSPKLFMRRRDLIAENPLPAPSAALLPIQVITRDEAVSTCAFNARKYYGRLETRGGLGRHVLFVPVTTTTIDVCRSLSDALPGYDGLCVVARQQLRGQGRGGNEFVSPVGVAMFNFSYALPTSAALAKCPSFIQHVACVAMAAGVHELSGMEDFPLRVKWPNDFYFNRSHKIGGLLVSAKTRDDVVEFSVGIGINVSNSLPTTCLNDMLPDNSPESANFVVEEVIAATLNKFEYFVNVYENKGQAAFLEHYYKYWLHSREEVTLGEESEKVVIRGLDKYGFLECRSRRTPSKLYSVADDGNTFDMMKGLIRMKIT